MVDIVQEINNYLNRLFPINRSITGKGNRETLRILEEIIPLVTKEYPSGTRVYDWTIPKEWNILDASITNEQGVRVIDFKENNLHIVSYSHPVNKTMSWKELQPHLHYMPELPEAIPYRTSYYKENWGFCVAAQQYRQLEQYKGMFKVEINSELTDGVLNIGELLIRGKNSQEILISTYICHPSMANDNISGVVLTAFLARELRNRKNLNNSYRFVFVPETIGAISYCSMNEASMKKVDTGLVITTVGGPGKFGYKQSFQKEHTVNQLIEDVFKDAGEEFITYPFDIHGSDERQYSSQGFRINCATICKDRYYEYPYYHTSLDNLDFVTAEQIQKTLILYIKLIEKFEQNQIYKNRYPNCEAMLSKHDLYPKMGGTQLPGKDGITELDLILWLLFFCDGEKTLLEISKQLDVPLHTIYNTAKVLEAKNTLERVLW